MIKINNLNSRTIDQIAKNEIADAEVLQNNELVFKSTLSKEKDSAYLEHVKDLISQIEAQGEKLGKKADMGEMQKYREMITKLLNETVSNGFAFEKEGKLGMNGRSKIFATIKRINKKLDDMTQKLLDDQQKNINLLDDIDDIRGLLVDMYF